MADGDISVADALMQCTLVIGSKLSGLSVD